MTFINMKMDKGDATDPVLSIFAWYDNMRSKGEIMKTAIPCLDFDGIGGYDFLSRLREESVAKGLRFILVKNSNYIIEPFSVEEARFIDIVRKYRDGSVVYWFESQFENKKITMSKIAVDSISEMCFVIRGFTWIKIKCEDVVITDKVVEGEDECEIDATSKTVVNGDKLVSYVYAPITIIVPCGRNPSKERRAILSAEKVVINGMELDVSMTGSYLREKYVMANEYKIQNTDLTMSNLALMNIKDWRELAPLMNDEGKSLFSESIDATLLSNALFSKSEVPAFNLLIIGPKRNQKTAALSFLVKDMMGGSIVSGSSSTGKGWLVSHKEGVAPSKMFSEKNCLMIDEALKFKSGEDQGVVVRVKNHFVSHMEIIERKNMEITSGNGVINGRMSCSLFCVDNPDLFVMGALGKAYKLQDASFRRWSFLWMDRDPNVKISYLTTEQAHRMMRKKFSNYGGMDAIKALMLLSRRKCDKEEKNADEVWLDNMKSKLKLEVDTYKMFPYIELLFSMCQDDNQRGLLSEEMKDHIDVDMEDAMQAAWLSAAAMRGWEVCKGYSDYKLVYDNKQENIAEMVVREIFKGRIKMLFPGIVEWIKDNSGIGRKSIFLSGGRYYTER